MRLFSCRGHEWPNRFPRIREALASLGARSITIDGEAVVLCPETGFSLFEELHLVAVTMTSSFMRSTCSTCSN